MKIPKTIQTLLDRRERLAYQLIETCCKLDTWLEKNGADLSDADLWSSTMSGCMIYSEPDSAKTNVMKYIEKKM